MAYLTEAAVTQRVGGTTDYQKLTDTYPSGAVDAELKKIFLDDVDAILDGYARAGGYATPLSSTDAASVMGYLLDISNYKLRTRGNREPSESDRTLFEAAMNVMTLIGNHQWEFSTPASVEDPSQAEIDSYPQMFSRDTLSVL